MAETDVDRVYAELKAVIEVVRVGGDVSDVVAIEAIAAKSLLLAAASHFERAIGDVIRGVAEESGTKLTYRHFIDKQALDRKYHTMFAWEAKNINRFLGLFGKESAARMAEAAKDDDISAAISDFILLGATRNLLVHENFAGFSLELTFEEVYARFESAVRLVDWLTQQLRSEAAR